MFFPRTPSYTLFVENELNYNGTMKVVITDKVPMSFSAENVENEKE